MKEFVETLEVYDKTSRIFYHKPPLTLLQKKKIYLQATYDNTQLLFACYL